MHPGKTTLESRGNCEPESEANQGDRCLRAVVKHSSVVETGADIFKSEFVCFCDCLRQALVSSKCKGTAIGADRSEDGDAVDIVAGSHACPYRAAVRIEAPAYQGISFEHTVAASRRRGFRGAGTLRNETRRPLQLDSSVASPESPIPIPSLTD